MHGLKTINELNTLAAQNAPGAAERELAAADASREGKPSNLEVAIAEHAQRREAEHAKAIANLSARSSEELISLARGHNACPSTLETVLANRLEEIIAANVRRSLIPAVATEDESGIVQSYFSDPNTNQTLETLD